MGEGECTNTDTETQTSARERRERRTTECRSHAERRTTRACAHTQKRPRKDACNTMILHAPGTQRCRAAHGGALIRTCALPFYFFLLLFFSFLISILGEFSLSKQNKTKKRKRRHIARCACASYYFINADRCARACVPGRGGQASAFTAHTCTRTLL